MFIVDNLWQHFASITFDLAFYLFLTLNLIVS